MSFLYPTYLLALLGLAVPVAIHLWSKKEGRTIKIGSIRLLSESDPKKTSSVKLNEIWLLLLRMLMIIVLVLILAQPRLKTRQEISPITYLVEPSLLNFEEVNELVDSLSADNSVRLLQQDFPVYEKENFSGADFSIPNYWQLASEMEALSTDSIVVFTNAFISGFKGRRPEVSENINWITFDPGEPESELLAAVRKGEAVQLISVESDHRKLKFNKERIPAGSGRIRLNEGMDCVLVSAGEKEVQLPLLIADSLNILIVHNDSLPAELKYLQNSFSAIGAYLERPVRVRTVEETENVDANHLDAVVWLSNLNTPEVQVPMLVYRPDSLAASLIEHGFAKNQYYLTGPLNSENIISEHLPERLLGMLDLHKDLEEMAKEYDQRTMDRAEVLPVQAGIGIENKTNESRDLSKYLWMLLLVLILAERGLARYKKQ